MSAEYRVIGRSGPGVDSAKVTWRWARHLGGSDLVVDVPRATRVNHDVSKTHREHWNDGCADILEPVVTPAPVERRLADGWIRLESPGKGPRPGRVRQDGKWACLFQCRHKDDGERFQLASYANPKTGDGACARCAESAGVFAPVEAARCKSWCGRQYGSSLAIPDRAFHPGEVFLDESSSSYILEKRAYCSQSCLDRARSQATIASGKSPGVASRLPVEPTPLLDPPPRVDGESAALLPVRYASLDDVIATLATPKPAPSAAELCERFGVWCSDSCYRRERHDAEGAMVEYGDKQVRIMQRDQWRDEWVTGGDEMDMSLGAQAAAEIGLTATGMLPPKPIDTSRELAHHRPRWNTSPAYERPDRVVTVGVMAMVDGENEGVPT